MIEQLVSFLSIQMPLVSSIVSLGIFFVLGFILINLIAGSTRKEDSISYASSRLKITLLLTFPALLMIIFSSYLLHHFAGFVIPIKMGPDSMLSLFFIFVTITVFVFTWGIGSSRGNNDKERTASERYKARFFLNIALYDFLILGFTFFGYVDSTSFFYRSLVLFSALWALLIFIYLLEFVVHFAKLETFVYDDLV